MKRRTRKDFAKAATEAHTDLTVFAAVVAMLEGGTVSARAQPYDFRVIALCQRAQDQCLRRFDRAMEKLLSCDT